MIKRKQEEVEVYELNEVFVREPSARVGWAYTRTLSQDDPGEDEVVGAQLDLLQECLVDRDGNQLFAENKDDLLELSFQTTWTLLKKIRDMMGVFSRNGEDTADADTKSPGG